MSTTGKTLSLVVVNRRRRLAVAMVAHGLTAGEAARELGVDKRTVERYKAKTRAEATR